MRRAAGRRPGGGVHSCGRGLADGLTEHRRGRRISLEIDLHLILTQMMKNIFSEQDYIKAQEILNDFKKSKVFDTDTQVPPTIMYYNGYLRSVSYQPQEQFVEEQEKECKAMQEKQIQQKSLFILCRAKSTMIQFRLLNGRLIRLSE